MAVAFLAVYGYWDAAIVTNTAICYSGHETDVEDSCFGEVILWI